MNNNLPARKPLRLPDYDYSTPGIYFITICTHNRIPLFSRIIGAIHESPTSQLTHCGQILESVIQNIPSHLHIVIDRYVIMPNHVHLLINVANTDPNRAIHESPLERCSVLSNTVGYIKMNTSKAIHKNHPNLSVWQRGYYDHVIRNQEDYNMIAKYIEENPLRWELDKLYKDTGDS